MVAVPWPSAEGEGTWQQYVNVPLEHLVGPARRLLHPAQASMEDNSRHAQKAPIRSPRDSRLQSLNPVHGSIRQASVYWGCT